jgi:hypothetical protein
MALAAIAALLYSVWVRTDRLRILIKTRNETARARRSRASGTPNASRSVVRRNIAIAVHHYPGMF